MEELQQEKAAWQSHCDAVIRGFQTSFALSPLHVRRLRVALVFVLGVQQCAGLRGVLALQPVLVESVQDRVDLRKTQRQAAVGLLHLLHQAFVHSASRLALRLASATQAPWGAQDRVGKVRDERL